MKFELLMVRQYGCKLRNDKSRCFVNCYDLAGLVQILLGLGMDTSPTVLRTKFMSPYG